GRPVVRAGVAGVVGAGVAAGAWPAIVHGPSAWVVVNEVVLDGHVLHVVVGRLNRDVEQPPRRQSRVFVLVAVHVDVVPYVEVVGAALDDHLATGVAVFAGEVVVLEGVPDNGAPGDGAVSQTQAGGREVNGGRPGPLETVVLDAHLLLHLIDGDRVGRRWVHAPNSVVPRVDDAGVADRHPADLDRHRD